MTAVWWCCRPTLVKDQRQFIGGTSRMLSLLSTIDLVSTRYRPHDCPNGVSTPQKRVIVVIISMRSFIQDLLLYIVAWFFRTLQKKVFCRLFFISPKQEMFLISFLGKCLWEVFLQLLYIMLPFFFKKYVFCLIYLNSLSLDCLENVVFVYMSAVTTIRAQMG